jgi:hypothetical protein
MIDLIKDLGGTSFKEELRGTAEGGHLEKLKPLIAQGKKLSQGGLFEVTNGAVKFRQLATVKYLITLSDLVPKYWNYLSLSAGKSGNRAMVDYIISQGGVNYTQLILGAIAGGHLDLATRYLDKPGLDYRNIFDQAIDYNYLDLAKLVARDHRIDQRVLNELMKSVKKGTAYETIDYLISLGGNNYQGLISKLARNNQIELFKRYYLSPGVDYAQVFSRSLENAEWPVVKFMLEKRLVPVTLDKLHSYIDRTEFNPELIELLLSLGVTDYRTIVEKALIHGDLVIAVKYFDQALGLRLNKVFKHCNKIPVYQYILSQGGITQKTVDATLARLEQSYSYDKAKNYLRSLSLQDGVSSSSSSSSSD